MENLKNDAPPTTETADPIILAVASLDTKGGTLIGEDMGGFVTCGISQD
jgi:hypothetical protein